MAPGELGEFTDMALKSLLKGAHVETHTHTYLDQTLVCFSPLEHLQSAANHSHTSRLHFGFIVI